MFLFESGDSSGEVSLSELFAAPVTINGSSTIDLKRLAFLTCRGGWPQTIDMSEASALRLAATYYDGLAEADVSRVDGARRR